MIIILIVCALLVLLPILLVQLQRAASTSVSPFCDSSCSSSSSSSENLTESTRPVAPPTRTDGSQKINDNVQHEQVGKEGAAIPVRQVATEALLQYQPELSRPYSSLAPQASAGSSRQVEEREYRGRVLERRARNAELPHVDGNRDTESDRSDTPTVRKQSSATPTQRKPWDPPFPNARAGTRMSTWRSLPAVDAITGSPKRLSIQRGSQDEGEDDLAGRNIQTKETRRSEEYEDENADLRPLSPNNEDEDQDEDLRPLSPGPPRPCDYSSPFLLPPRKASIPFESPTAPPPKIGSSLYFQKGPKPDPEPRNSSVWVENDADLNSLPQISSQAFTALERVASRNTPPRSEPRLSSPRAKEPEPEATVPLSYQRWNQARRPPPPPPRPAPSFHNPNSPPPDPPDAEELSPSPTPPPPRPSKSPSASHTPGSRMSLLKSIALVLASLMSIFLFAVLIAHCLAWFIVYKTEARLGEAKRGLLVGGEMRMCLCAR